MKTMQLTTALAGLTLGVAAFAEGEVEERHNMAADGMVSVSNVTGEIEIETWDKNEILIQADVGKGSTLEIDETSRGFVIEVESDDDGRWGRDSEETNIYLRIPEGASVNAEGVSSDITITGVQGDKITAESVSGDVEVEGDVNQLDLSSVSGDVSFAGSSPRTQAETVSGDVELDGVSGEVEVSLVSGDVGLYGGSFSRGQFESVSGTLELELTMETGGRLTIESMSGDVNLNLPPDQQGEIRAQTFSGDIHSKFGSTQSDQNGPGTHLKYSSGDDGASIRVEVFSGDIEIGHK